MWERLWKEAKDRGGMDAKPRVGERLNFGQTVTEAWTVRTPEGWGSKGNGSTYWEGTLLYSDSKLSNILGFGDMESRKCAHEPGGGWCWKLSPGFLLLLLVKCQWAPECPFFVLPAMMNQPCVLLSCCCCDNLPRTGWLKTMQMHYLQFWRSDI